MRILVSPGQGSQTPGFLNSWLEALPGLTLKLKEFSEVAEVDLIELGTLADEETIKHTANAQPLIVGASLAVARVAQLEKKFDGFAGHSVGEFAAAALAGVVSDLDAMRLVGIRARAMATAANEESTGMIAVIGTDEEQIAKAVSDCGLTIANFNGGGQFVAAGPIDAIGTLVQNPPEKVRAIQLKVAGAFHTSFMESAVAELRNAAAGVTVSNPQKPFWSNSDGQQLHSGEDILASLIAQVSRPVRWDLCMQSFVETNVDLAVELPPAGALTGLLKRGAPTTNPIALKNPEDLEKV